MGEESYSYGIDKQVTLFPIELDSIVDWSSFPRPIYCSTTQVYCCLQDEFCPYFYLWTPPFLSQLFPTQIACRLEVFLPPGISLSLFLLPLYFLLQTQLRLSNRIRRQVIRIHVVHKLSRQFKEQRLHNLFIRLVSQLFKGNELDHLSVITASRRSTSRFATFPSYSSFFISPSKISMKWKSFSPIPKIMIERGSSDPCRQGDFHSPNTKDISTISRAVSTWSTIQQSLSKINTIYSFPLVSAAFLACLRFTCERKRVLDRFRNNVLEIGGIRGHHTSKHASISL